MGGKLLQGQLSVEASFGHPATGLCGHQDDASFCARVRPKKRSIYHSTDEPMDIPPKVEGAGRVCSIRPQCRNWCYLLAVGVLDLGSCFVWRGTLPGLRANKPCTLRCTEPLLILRGKSTSNCASPAEVDFNVEW
jgi:hypothetical protein